MHLHGQPWASQYKKASTGMVSVPVDGWFSGFIKLGLPHYLVGGWVWNMNFMTFYILGIITDFHIFQRGRLKPPSTLPRIFSRKDLFHIGLSRRSRSFLSASRSAPDLQVCAGAVTFFRVKDSSFPIVKPSFFLEMVRDQPSERGLVWTFGTCLEIHFAFMEKMIRYRWKNSDTTKIIDWEWLRDIERKLMISPFSSSKNPRSRDDFSPTSEAVSQPGGPTCHGIGSRMVPGPGHQGVGQVRW